jgi:hypothetical protein
MADGVQPDEKMFHVKLVDFDLTNKFHGTAWMKYTQTFGKLISRFCKETEKVISDFTFTLPSGAEVSMDDSPLSLKLEGDVTITYKLNVAHVTLKFEHEQFHLIIKLRHTFFNSFDKFRKNKKMDLTNRYKLSYTSGGNVSETDTPITKGMTHGKDITILCKRVYEDSKTRSGREY